MIFVDHTGRRWRRIKRSTLGLTFLATLPFAALIAGALAYSPHWSLLPLAMHPAAAPIQAANSVAPASAATPTKPNLKPTTITRHTATPSAIASPAPAPAPALAAFVAQSQTIPTSPAPEPPVDPGNSPFGHSHQPTR